MLYMNEQIIIIVALSGGLLLCVLLAAAFLVQRTVIATVAGFSWFRQVFLEHYVWVSETSHAGFPDGSRNQTKTVEHYQSYEYIRTETRTTTVNGQTTTTTGQVYGYVPRRRTKYMYEIQKWVESRRLEAEGEERASLHWPAYTLNRSNQERVEKTRERYLVFFQNVKGKRYKRELSEADWIALDDQSSYVLKVNIFGYIKQFTPCAAQEAEINVT
jgi:hypothetical protein